MNINLTTESTQPNKNQRKSYKKYTALGAAALVLLGIGAYYFASKESSDVNVEMNDGILQSLYKLEPDDRYKGFCSDSKKRCNVLVVVDMQNDYCKGCGSPTESPWSTDALLKIVPNIN